MTGRFKDITGSTFGELTVIGRLESRNGFSQWRCLCTCGKETSAITHDLKSGHTKSCGCLRYKGRHNHTGISWRSPTYSSWTNMVSRCTRKSSPAFAHYKKRKINLCERWRTFENFLSDMGERPSLAHSLDRHPNNDGNYEPGNVRWATKTEQANNRMTNLQIMYKNKPYTLMELVRETGVHKDLLRSRLFRNKSKWTVEGAINTPVLPKGTRFSC